MHKWHQIFWTLLLLLALLVTPLHSLRAETDEPTAPEAAPPIRLAIGNFVPGAAPLALDPALTITGYLPGEQGYYLVQFRGPVQEAWKSAVQATGAQLLGYIPDYAFKVRMTPEIAAQVATLPAVGWVGIFQPAYKLSLDLPNSGNTLFAVRLERGANIDAAVNAIQAAGLKVIRRHNSGVLQVLGAATQQNALALVRDVAWVDQWLFYERHNESAAGVILGGNTANASGYDGSTQTTAVADSGLGDGTPASAHPDIPANRIKAIHNWPGQPDAECFQEIADDGAKDVDSGHGTHVAASVLSDGDATGVGKGAASAAKLVFQATENYVTFTPLCALIIGAPSAYMLAGLPVNLNELFQQAYDEGARIHANSWGSAKKGEYTENSAEADEFIWNHPDMAITFSAGNSGIDENKDGVVDNGSLGAPATAKNVIAIGASENARPDNFACDPNLTYPSHEAYQQGKTCAEMGGKNLINPHGSRYAEPLLSDPSAGNAEQMAAFSSRGPTTDGRIKPDVVAPGTWILSGYSGLYQEGYGDPVNPQVNEYQWDGYGLPFSAAYKYMSGTSMSNPIAAGAATVVRDFYQKKHNLGASAALVKATLINSAVDLQDENNDGANDNDFAIPNLHEGWGRINLANATDNTAQFVDEKTGLKTGEVASQRTTVQAAGKPLKITLVWSDYPADPAVGPDLVNNLDLVVTAPSGKTYLGNVFTGGWSQTGGTADKVNNVENVYLREAEAGEWKVEVKALNAPQGPQPFALLIDGGAAGTVQPQLTTIQPNSGDAGQALTVTITGENTNFKANQSRVDFGDGITVGQITVNSATQLTAVITIDADAEAGARDVAVITGEEAVRKAAGFTVNAGTATPALLSIQPDNGTPGDTRDVTIKAVNTNFVNGRTDADFGPGIVISTVTVIDPTQVVVNLRVEEQAQPGERIVKLTTGAEVVAKSSGFRVNVVNPSGNATLYIDPTPTNMVLNAKGKVEIMLSPGATPINGVQIHGKVDPAFLRLLNVTSDAQHLSEILDPVTFDAATGVFRFGAGILGKTVAEPFVVLTLELEARQGTGANGTPITFLNTFPATDISGPSGSVMEAARDGVVIITGQATSATLQGRIDLQGRPAKPALGWSVPVTVELIPANNGTPLVRRVTTDQRGEFTISDLTVGTYALRIKGDHTLGNRVEKVELQAGVNSFFFGTLFEGDVENNTTGNQTVIADFGQLSGSFGKCEQEAGYIANADLDESDNCVTITDYGLLSPNFNKQGDILYADARKMPAPLQLAQANAVLAFENANVFATPGVPLDLLLYVDPRGGDAVAGVTASYSFNPAALEVLEVTLTGGLPRVLAQPVVDNGQGALTFAVGGELGKTVNQRLHIATLRVKLKASTGAQLTPKVGGPRDTNIAGSNGSIMAGAETVLSNSGVNLFNANLLTQRVYMPVVRR